MYRPWLTTPCNPAQPRRGKQSVIASSHNSAAHETCEDTAAPERCSEIPLSHSSQITDCLSHSVGASAVGVCLPIKNINSPWLILRLNTMRLYPASAEVANQNG